VSNFAPGAGLGPATIISRSTDQLDIFAVGLDGRVYTAAWQPGDTTWRGWWPIEGLEVAPCAPVTAVSRAKDKLDIFAVGLDGRVYTAAWQPGDPAWRGWWPIGELTTTLHAPIAAISRATDKLDLLVTGLDGRIYAAAWEPDDPAWRGWWSVAEGAASPGAPIGLVSRAPDKLDAFVVGPDSQVYTAAWEPGDADWRGWWPVAGGQALPRSMVTAISRATDKLDLFVLGLDSQVYTAAWEPGDADWRGWWPVLDGLTAPPMQVGVVSRATDKLDLVMPGLDGRIWTAAWEPGDTNWRGWQPIGDLVTGQTDPGVGAWQKVGIAFQSENTNHSNEAQGVTTDGAAWYLVSNGSKTVRKYDNGANLLGQIKVPHGAHIGAADCYAGWIYVPTQGPFGVWRTPTDFSSQEFLPADGGKDRFAWCAVNPLNGRLYTCEFDIYNNANGVLYAHDRDTLVRCPEDDLPLGPTPIHFDRLQGGVFTARGRLLISRSGPNGVFCFSAVTGQCFGGRHLGNFGSTGSEGEGITVRPWQFGAQSASVHVLELDNDAGTDDCYLHSYAVPEPDRL